jgi:hypothetical protein
MEAELDALGAVEAARRGRRAAGRGGGHPPGALIALRAARPGLRVRSAPGAHGGAAAAARLARARPGRGPPLRPGGARRPPALPMWEEPIAVLARAGHPLLRRRGAVTAAALAEYEMVLPTSASASGRRSSTCSTCSPAGTCPCARPPTASSGRCCWRATRCPSCRAR